MVATVDDPETLGEHYFTARPASPSQRRALRVHLGRRDVEVESAAGIFSPRRVDLGTEVLLRSVPEPPAVGDLLDLGCGWGPIALTLAMAAPGATVWALDVNERALDLTRRNAERLGLANIQAVTPDAVPDPVRFAAIWSNPPIRVGKEALHALLLTWLDRLAPEGEAFLVVQRNLGADSLHRWLEDRARGGGSGGGSVARAASAKGYRVLRVTAQR
jgi:16S rRNA (guanine1207-N2)-methyltransferase